MVIKRRRFKQTQPLEVRLAEEAMRLGGRRKCFRVNVCVMMSKKKLYRSRQHAN
jgi:hypothetical protein